MKKILISFLIALSVLMLVLTEILFDNSKKFTNDILKLMEKSYGEGQASVLKNDIRIKMLNDSTFVWIKSPWNDKTKIPTDTVKISK